MKGNTLVLAICTGLSACYEQPQTLIAHDVLRATVEQVILPDLDTFKRTAEDVHEHAQRFCLDPSSSRLQTVQFSWKGGKRLLKTMELLNFGPYTFAEIDISRKLDKWPERGEGIEMMISGDQDLNADYLSSVSRADVSHGYPALGYLLYSEGDTDAQVARFQEERRCAYLVAQTELNQGIVRDFYHAWSPEGLDYASELSLAGKGTSYFVSPEEAIGTLLISMNRLVQHMADLKLAQPLDMGRMDSVEAQYSATSLRDLSSNLDSIARLYSEPSPSISDYIKAQQGEDIDIAIVNGIQTVRDALDTIPEPLSLSITEEPQKVAELIVALEGLSDVLTYDAQRFLAYAP